jgi:hypothetical protein
MISQTQLKSIILRYEIGSLSGDRAMESIIEHENVKPSLIPFTYHDFNQFMLKQVCRKESSFLNEIWTVVGLSGDKVLIQNGENDEWKLYSSMFEDWQFIDGRPFGK